jgi:hypothetical protein
VANYGVDIELSVKGLNHLRQLEREINSIEQAAQKVRTIDVSGATKVSTSVLEAERRALQLSGKERRQNLILANRAEQTEQRINAILERRQQIQQRNQQIRSRAATATSSALIGGGFPLLFGQGGVAAAGGALGGAVGGALGGGFGFALSIIGTAIGDAITKAEEFDKSLNKLNARTSNLGSEAVITGGNINDLAKTMSIAKDEAMDLFGAFSDFDAVANKEALALIFGDDPGTFDRLAAATTELKLAKEIFADRKRIGNQTASQLLDQLKIGNAASVELGLAEARLRIAEKQAVKDAERVTLMDRLLAAAATSQMSMGIMDPAAFGQERGEKLQKQFDENRRERLDAFKKSLEEVRDLIGKVTFFEPPKKPERNKEAEKLKRELQQSLELAERLERSFDQQVRQLTTGSGEAERRLRIEIEYENRAVQVAKIKQEELRLDLERENIRIRELEYLRLETEELFKQAGLSKEITNALGQRMERAQEGIIGFTVETKLLDLQKEKLDEVLKKYPLIGQAAQEAGNLATFGAMQMISGAKSAEEVFADFLNNIANLLMKAAAQMITTYIAIGVARMFAGIPATQSAGDKYGAVAFGGGGPTFNPSAFSGGSLLGRANGGPVTANKPYMVGERGPELFVPGASGNIVPNHAMGGSNIVVNVDATGSNVQGNGNQAKALGSAIGAAVRAELINQQRPGGLLA